MIQCVMCHKEFEKVDLDWCGRCEPCFRKYLSLKDSEKPDMGVPFTPVSQAIK